MFKTIHEMGENLDRIHSRMNRQYRGRTDEIQAVIKGWGAVCDWCEIRKGADYAAALREQFLAMWKQACQWEAIYAEMRDAIARTGVPWAQLSRIEGPGVDECNRRREKARDLIGGLAVRLCQVAKETAESPGDDRHGAEMAMITWQDLADMFPVIKRDSVRKAMENNRRHLKCGEGYKELEDDGTGKKEYLYRMREAVPVLERLQSKRNLREIYRKKTSYKKAPQNILGAKSLKIR